MRGTVLLVGATALDRSQVGAVVKPLCLTLEEVAGSREALVSVAHRHPSLVMVNAPSPGVVGVGLVRDLRQVCPAPVIVISSHFVEEECVNALVWGADDYVAQPVSPREFAARIGAVLRRAGQHWALAPQNDVADFGRLRIDHETRQVSVGGSIVELRTKEFDLLAYLARNPMKVFSREELLRAVWSSSSQWQDPSTITEHVRRIRLRLAGEGISHEVISAVRSAGYRFDPHICELDFAKAG